MFRLIASARENMRKQETVRSLDTCLETIRNHGRNRDRNDGRDQETRCSALSRAARVALILMATGCTTITIGCATSKMAHGPSPSGMKGDFEPVSMKEPVLLRLKAQPKASETVDYYHISASRAFEGRELRHEKTETVGFTATAETVKAEGEKFTQNITVTKKDGTIGLHDFAMPEPGERLEIVADAKGKILKAGDWPTNSIFYVSPISLPENPVEVGDTWVMQSSWLSLQDMVPYELEMVSILKGFVKCGNDTCADIEINGNVGMQGQLKQTLVFRSEWRGRLLFAIDAGTVAWSRTNSEETFAYDRIHRTVGSCLEAALREPAARAILPGDAKPVCEGFAPPVATASGQSSGT